MPVLASVKHTLAVDAPSTWGCSTPPWSSSSMKPSSDTVSSITTAGSCVHGAGVTRPRVDQ